LHLNFRGIIPGLDIEHPLNDGSVVVGYFSSSCWIVSTIWTKRYGKHFLSGNRQWGYSGIPGDYIYYTRAVDRMTPPFLPLRPFNPVYNAQREYWGGFQKKVCGFVINHKGMAEVLPQTDVRHDWEPVEKIYHRNTTIVPRCEAAVLNPAKPGNRYTVMSGDSLSLIAGKLWNDALLWPILYDSNKAVVGSNPNLIKPRQVLTIPDIRRYSPSQLSNARAWGRL
jgi:LysM repeat protein